MQLIHISTASIKSFCRCDVRHEWLCSMPFQCNKRYSTVQWQENVERTGFSNIPPSSHDGGPAEYQKTFSRNPVLPFSTMTVQNARASRNCQSVDNFLLSPLVFLSRFRSVSPPASLNCTFANLSWCVFDVFDVTGCNMEGRRNIRNRVVETSNSNPHFCEALLKLARTPRTLM